MLCSFVERFERLVERVREQGSDVTVRPPSCTCLIL